MNDITNYMKVNARGNLKMNDYQPEGLNQVLFQGEGTFGGFHFVYAEEE